jgi:hypothetical protein
MNKTKRRYNVTFTRLVHAECVVMAYNQADAIQRVKNFDESIGEFDSDVGECYREQGWKAERWIDRASEEV